MNRQFFMAELSRRLSGLPPAERESTLLFYEELFDEAGPDKEAEVIGSLGSPYQVAAKILAEFAAEQTLGRGAHSASGNPYAHSGPEQPRRRISWLWYLLLGILAAPVALPVAIAAISVLVALMVALLVTLVSVGAAVIAWVVAAVGLFAGGIYSLALFPSGGVALIGVSLMMISATLLLFIPLRFVVERMIDLIVRGAAYAFNKLTGGAAR